jgi:hypothetical protein
VPPLVFRERVFGKNNAIRSFGKMKSRYSISCQCFQTTRSNAQNSLVGWFVRRTPSRAQLLQQRLRVPQIARIKPLRKPPVNRSQQFARLLHPR